MPRDSKTNLQVAGNTVRGWCCAHLGSFYEWDLRNGVLVTHRDSRGRHHHTKEPCHNLGIIHQTPKYFTRFRGLRHLNMWVGYMCRVWCHVGASFLRGRPGHSAATGATDCSWRHTMRHTVPQRHTQRHTSSSIFSNAANGATTAAHTPAIHGQKISDATLFGLPDN